MVLGSLTVLIAGAALFGLFYYVKETRKIADATKLQGDVLSRPTITVLCNRADNPRQKHARIATFIENHSSVHAKVKIDIKAILHVESTGESVEFHAPQPYDGSMWPFPAKLPFTGVFTFQGLQARAMEVGDTLTLLGSVESSPYWGKPNYRADPSIKYLWKQGKTDDESRWVPCPPEN